MHVCAYVHVRLVEAGNVSVLSPTAVCIRAPSCGCCCCCSCCCLFGVSSRIGIVLTPSQHRTEMRTARPGNTPPAATSRLAYPTKVEETVSWSTYTSQMSTFVSSPSPTPDDHTSAVFLDLCVLGVFGSGGVWAVPHGVPDCLWRVPHVGRQRIRPGAGTPREREWRRACGGFRVDEMSLICRCTTPTDSGLVSSWLWRRHPSRQDKHGV